MERVSDDDQPVTDRADIAKAARALARIIEKDWSENENRRLPVILLRALCRLEEAGDADLNEGWVPVAIAQVMAKLGAPGWENMTDDDARKRVNDHWKTLIDDFWNQRLQDLTSRLIADLQVSGLVLRPELDKPPAVGRTHTVRYRLRFFPVLSEPSATAESVRPSALPASGQDDIHYYQVTLTLPRLLRLFPTDGLRMSGWPGRLLAVIMTGSGLAVLLLALLTLLLVLSAGSVLDFLRNLFVSGLLLAMMRMLLGWWWDLAQNNVARAPFLWQPFEFGDNVIERRRDPDGAQPPSLHLVRYVAECPLCGADGPGRSAVRIESGRLEFFGRIVGRCRHAPNEHVWSFDHITQRGRSLREGR